MSHFLRFPSDSVDAVGLFARVWVRAWRPGTRRGLRGRGTRDEDRARAYGASVPPQEVTLHPGSSPCAPPCGCNAPAGDRVGEDTSCGSGTQLQADGMDLGVCRPERREHDPATQRAAEGDATRVPGREDGAAPVRAEPPPQSPGAPWGAGAGEQGRGPPDSLPRWSLEHRVRPCVGDPGTAPGSHRKVWAAGDSGPGPREGGEAASSPRRNPPTANRRQHDGLIPTESSRAGGRGNSRQSVSALTDSAPTLSICRWSRVQTSGGSCGENIRRRSPCGKMGPCARSSGAPVPTGEEGTQVADAPPRGQGARGPRGPVFTLPYPLPATRRLAFRANEAA